MKTKITYRLLILGLFGLIPTGILAQTGTGTVVVTPSEHEIREAREAAREAAVSYSYSYALPQEKSSRLSLHKQFNGQTVSKEGEIIVEDNVKRMKLNIHGSVQSGQIKITLFLPDGTKFKSLSIDDTSDMEWATSFSIEEGEKKYYGTWKYKIETTKADGMYALSLTTY